MNSSSPSALLLAPHSADRSPEHFRQRYAHQIAALSERLRIPAPDDIYAPNEARLAVRPRLYFGSLTPADLRRRAADPRYAHIVDYLHDFASRAADLLPPATIGMKDHDPNRAYADSLAWMAASVLIHRDAARRARTLAGLLRWVGALRAWGPFENDLALAQTTIGLTCVYDWLHDELPQAEREALRLQIIAQARFSLDENLGGFTMWRGQRFAANHNWANYSARAFAAMALWGDTGAPLAPGELKSWLDDAMVNFWIVQHTHATDGAPMEGPGYQDYGLRFLLDFAWDAESLLTLRTSFFDENLRALSARLFTLLPGNRGAMVYADGYPYQWGAQGYNFRRLATHFRDARSQLVADLLESAFENIYPLNWRSLFAYDPDLAPARLEDQPLAHDMRDFGLYTARSSWKPDATFFGLRCGPASAESVVRALGYDFGEAHLYANQGDIVLYSGPVEVLPCCTYATSKPTSNHHLVVFEGRDSQAGRIVGQLGEGGAWFNGLAPVDPDTDYDRRDRAARVLAADHPGECHRYLCDLGGIYRLRDERVPGGFFFAEYLRSAVFLPDGAVAIVDRVRTPVPRTFLFRLLTASEDLALVEGGFKFTVGGLPCRIDDFSPLGFERTVHTENVTTRDQEPRGVASLRAVEAREGVFAVVLGVGTAAGRYVIAADELGYTLSLRTGGDLLRCDWPSDGAA